MMMLISVVTFAQRTVSGTVKDAASGEPIPGATVLVKGSSNGTTTDMDGNYRLQVSETDGILVFSFIGYANVEATVGSRSVVNVDMTEDVTELGEVVVTAFGIEKDKKALGYAVTGVESEDLSTVKQSNVVNSLAGRVPGLVITQSTGGIGSGSRVVIRGNNSLTGNNQPLYVVDGVPVDNSGFGSAGGDDPANYERVDYGTGISDLNPDDIESMSILKGPNAAALYGSRAANGVIMITTKKGRTNKGLGVTYSSNFTWENPLLLPKYQNEYGQGSNGNTYTVLSELKSSGAGWGPKLDGSNQLYWNGETKPYTAQPDNVADFFETGFNAINTVAIDGGNENASARFSYSNSSFNSIVPNSNLQKNNFNLRATAKASERLSFDSRVTYFHQETQNRISQGTEGMMANVYTMPRNLILNDLKDYRTEELGVNTWSASGGNPYWTLYNDRNQDYRDRFSGFIKATVELTDDLSVFGRVGSDQVTQKTERVEQPGHWFYQSGRLNFNTYKTGETNADFLFMYNKEVSKVGVSVNAGGNYRMNTYEQQGVSGENFKIPTKPIVESASILSPSYTPTQTKKVTSLYASAEFSYDNFVYLNLSARNDWSSALPVSNNSYFYPSASLSVLIDRFVDPNASFLDYWKIRTSWAQVGNDTDPFQLNTPYYLESPSNSYLGLPVLYRSAIEYDPDLKPEQTASFEVGTDFSALGNRLYADVSYYSISSTDLILTVGVQDATGFDQYHTNVGEITNQGVELMFGGTVIKSSDFSWDISANFARNRNKLVSLLEGAEDFTFTTTNAGTVNVRATVGGGYGDIYGYTYERDDAGNIVTGADGVPMRNSDYTLLGNYQPDWTGGLSNNLKYKNLSLRLLVDARIGGEVFSGTDAALDGSGLSEKTLEYREGGVVVAGVTNTGTSEAPVYSTNEANITAQQYWGNYSSIPENYIFDQTNIRLREASLNFRLPKSLISATPFQDITVGVIGRNLFFLYKKMDNFDPESSYSTSNFAQGVLFYNLPTTRQYGINLNIKF